MKPNPKQNRGLSTRANRVFEQARTQFGRAVIDVLSSSLEALGERLGGEKLETFQNPDNVEDQPRHRLRRMLQSDRGLGARNYESGRFEHALAEETLLLAPAQAPEPLVEADADAPESATGVPEAAPVESEPTQPTATASALVESAPDPIEQAAPEPVAVAEPAVVAPAVARAREATDEPPICDEPIRTRSMARLLASQGHHRRALSIYDVLLAANTSDAALAAEAAALRSLAEQQPSPQ